MSQSWNKICLNDKRWLQGIILLLLKHFIFVHFSCSIVRYVINECQIIPPTGITAFIWFIQDTRCHSWDIVLGLYESMSSLQVYDKYGNITKLKWDIFIRNNIACMQENQQHDATLVILTFYWVLPLFSYPQHIPGDGIQPKNVRECSKWCVGVGYPDQV